MKNLYSFVFVFICIIFSVSVVYAQKKNNTKSVLDAQFLVSSYEIQAGQCVNFTDMTTGNPTHWQWTFEGAQTTSSVEQSPSDICYYHEGVYQVILVVQNGQDVDTEIVTECITVHPNTEVPIADFTANFTTIPVNGVVQFSDISQNGPFMSYLWEFEGGLPSTSTEATPTPISYPHEGCYNVKLTVVDMNGVQDVEERMLYINVVPETYLPPEANFIGDRTYIQPGDVVNFTDRSKGYPYIWHWYFEGAATTTSNVQNPSGIMFPMPGTYDVELVIESNVGLDTIRKENYITVSANDNCDSIPEARFKASPRLIKAGTRVFFEDLSTNNPTAWTWEFEGGYPNVAATANIINGVEYNRPGIYSVFHSVSNQCGVSSVTKENYIMVFSATVPYYCDTISNVRPNEIPSAHLSNQQWNKIRYVADKFSQHSFEQVEALVVPVKEVNAGSYNSEVIFYVWSVGDDYTPDSVLVEKKVFLRDIPENYYYVVEFDNPIKVDGPFFAGYRIKSSNDKFVVSTVRHYEQGSVTLWVKTNTGEWQTSSEYISNERLSSGIMPVACITKAEQVVENLDVNIYPNPASNYVNIDFGTLNATDDVVIEVFDALGRKVHFQTCNSGEQQLQINVSTYNAGIYVVKLVAGEHTITEKVSILR